MSITINIYYSGKNGAARSFAKEMTSSGVVAAIRAERGNLQYEYFYSMDDVKLENTEIVYQAFMKSKTSENSDRLIVIYRLQASGQVNRSDEQEELQEERSSIYYMVVFPSINDSGVIPDASAYGEKVLLSSEPDEKALDQALKTYLENKGRGGYQIEAITSREEAAAEDEAASDDQQEKQADQAENE